jgi:excisionase family DNA binding protein
MATIADRHYFAALSTDASTPAPIWFTTRQAQVYLQLSAKTLYTLARQHRIPCHLVAHRRKHTYRFQHEALDAWVRGKRAKEVGESFIAF